MNYDLRFRICGFIAATMGRRSLLPLLGERIGVRAVFNSIQKGAE